MKTFLWMLLSAVAWLSSPAAAADALPSDSVYQLDIPLVQQDGSAARLGLDRGSPVLISMFYSSCPHACPLLINTMRRMEQQLAPEARQRLKVLLVSIDPERDSPEKLKELAERHRVDAARWTFARASADDVRKLAAVLGIRYRALPDGEFNHSTIVTLLDANGKIVLQTSEMTTLDEAFVAALRKATSAP